MKETHAYIFILLCLLYMAFSSTLYIRPALHDAGAGAHLQEAAAGRLTWQKYNCQSCHQLYGSGGYLGPDLTNVISAPGKGEVYVAAMIKAGTARMPSFQMPEDETQSIIAFLKQTDASGNSDPRNFAVHYTGMIEAQ